MHQQSKAIARYIAIHTATDEIAFAKLVVIYKAVSPAA
jgi:hypothetical protein